MYNDWQTIQRISTGKPTRLVLVLGLILFSLSAIGQNINRPMVNQLLLQLRRSKADENRVHVLMELGKFHIYKPGEAKIDLDSGRTYLNRAKKLSDSLHLLSWYHDAESMLVVADLEERNTQGGQARLMRLIHDCQRTGDRLGEANTRFRWAVWLRNSSEDYQPVFANFRQAAAIYRSIPNPEKEISALKEMADTYLYQGDLDSAEAGLNQALNRYKTIKYPKLHYTYNSLSSVGILKGDYEKGLRYALLSIENMHQTGDTASAAAYYSDLGRIYEETGNHPKALEWYKKSLVKWRQEKLANFAMFNTAGFIAKDLIAQHKPKEALQLLNKLIQEIPTNTFIQKACVAQNLAYCYDALHQYPVAEHYYKEALAWYEKNKLDFEASQKAEQDIGTFYLKQKDFAKAEFHLRKALSFSPQKNARSTIKDIHLLLFKVDSARGNYVSAIQHFRLHKALSDSLFNEKKSKQIASLQIKYDTRKKEQDIALLREQSRLQQIELSHERTTRNGIIVGAVLLAGLLGVSYQQYRLKQRSNQLLQTKQLEINRKNDSLEQILLEKENLLEEKEWMLKEIHHRVKNNLQIISSMLNTQLNFLQDSNARTAIKDSQNRVHAMALIHQKLYQSEHLALVNMAEFIHEIVDYLMESFPQTERIRTKLDVSGIQMDVAQAIPIGLIINEAVTNSLKYAFPHNRPGLIGIQLQLVQPHQYRVRICDDGVGFPQELNLEDVPTLGLTMIRGLSRQIGAALVINQATGVEICLEFGGTPKADRAKERQVVLDRPL